MAGEMSILGSTILALFLAGYLGQQYLPPPKPTVIGLDLGTTFCSVGVFHPGVGDVEVIGDAEGRKSIPSVVSFTLTEVHAGYAGQELADSNPYNTIYDAKRFIGKIFDKPEDLERESARYPFKVVYNNGSVEFLVSTNRTFAVSPEFIGSRLLLTMRRMAEKQLGVPVRKAVISVPAEFDERQRNYTVRAANLAGLDILRVINEPTAAAMAYGLHKADVSNVLVVDLGGGTLDVSLLNKQGDVLHQGHGSPASSWRCPCTWRRAAPGPPPEAKPVLFQEPVTRELFEDLNADLFQKILVPVRTVLAEGRLEREEVDEVVLVGGSTRIPRIRRIIAEFFGKEPNTSVDPDLAVVTGVAIQAGIMGGAWPLQVSALEIPNRHLQKRTFH
ncbi:hypothetical protein ANANG_G00232380 [Anguilla anguilla]|uniref:Heat shock 70 kDa protein 13 n=1 Tax=Anguilla anguilla TaxID=7936 RepID=A0A9D3LXN2_ANGAN|nr:hypothetical protein ANANG_G00232380 [Anguilla anguilla]